MPRTKPTYNWNLTEGKPLKHETHTHRISGKGKDKGFKTSKPPANLPKVNGQHTGCALWFT